MRHSQYEEFPGTGGRPFLSLVFLVLGTQMTDNAMAMEVYTVK